MQSQKISLKTFVLENLDVSNREHLLFLSKMNNDELINSYMYHFEYIFGPIDQITNNYSLHKGIYLVRFLNNLIGYLDIESFDTNYKDTYINLSFLAEYRHCGYGTILLKELLSFLKEIGFEEIKACVKPDNKASIHLLAKSGFTNTEGCDWVKSLKK